MSSIDLVSIGCYSVYMYPKYYLLEGEIPVKLSLNEAGEVEGTNHLGNPYPIGKAIVEGQKISKEEFEVRSKRLTQSLPSLSSVSEAASS